jgi:hypothetical protein
MEWIVADGLIPYCDTELSYTHTTPRLNQFRILVRTQLHIYLRYNRIPYAAIETHHNYSYYCIPFVDWNSFISHVLGFQRENK